MNNKTEAGLFMAFFITLFSVDMMGCKNTGKKIPEQVEKKTILGEATTIIGREGGTVNLQGGISIMIEPGIMTSDNPVTVALLPAEKYFGMAPSGYTVLQCKATQKEFSKPVTIRIPVPKEWQGKTALQGAGGEIDETTGIITSIPSEIKDINGVKMLLLRTNHFSTYAGWFWETAPAAAGPLEIPYYRQGSASTCWAASIQMLCEGVKHKQFHEVYDILKKAGYTDGVSPGQFKFFSSAIAHMRIYTDATAVTEYWQYNSGNGMANAIRHHIALGHPVMLLTNYPIMSTVSGHAVIITGYDGGYFFVHDPASVARTNTGYRSVAISDLVKIGIVKTNAATITALPATIAPLSLISLSPEEHTVRFTGPKKEGFPQEETYDLIYNAGAVNGYSFVSGTMVPIDTIPATVTKLVIKNLPLANASRSNSKTAAVEIFISGPPELKSYKKYSEKGIAVGPNSVVEFSKEIDLADLPNRGTEYTLYSIKVSVRTDGASDDDEFTLEALMAPPDPLNGDWNISSTITAATSNSVPAGSIGKSSLSIGRIAIIGKAGLWQLLNEENGQWENGVLMPLERQPGDMLNFVFALQNQQKDAWTKVTITGKMTGPDSWTATEKIVGIDQMKKPISITQQITATRRKKP